MNEAATEAFARLDVLAEKLGVATDHFWPVFVRQQLIEGWLFAAFGAVFIGSCSGLAAWGLKGMSFDKDPGPRQIAGIVTAVILVVSLIPFLAEGGTFLAQIVNPEYGALRDVVQMLRQ